MKLDPLAVLMGVAFALMWSSAFATAHIIVADAPPLTALTLRFVVSGLIAVAVARALGQTWNLPGGWRGPQARAVMIFGLCQNALYLGLNFTAMQWNEASLSAIIASSMPLIVAALGFAFTGERTGPLGLAGLSAGFTGVALIMGARLTSGADPLGVLLCVVGALAFAVATLSVRGAMGSGNLLMIVGLQMLVGAALLALPALAFEQHSITLSPALIAAFAYQIVVPGLTATLTWFWLVKRIGAIRASTYHFLNPFFGVSIAALLLGESIGALDIAGVTIAAAGILAVQLSRAQPRQTPR